MSENFGVSAALLTPFNADGSIAGQMMADHARYVLDNGCSSLTLFGTTGEGASLGLTERIWAVRFLRQAGIASERMILGIEVDAPPQAIAELQAGIELQCRSFLLAPPHYYKGVSDAGLYAWYCTVLEGFSDLDLRIILYNIPQVTGVEITPKLAARLYDRFPSLVYGVKDSSGEWGSAEALLALKDDLAILIGDERLLGRGCELGAQGCISGLANFYGGLLRQIVNTGQQNEAISALVEALMPVPVVPAVKLIAARVFGQEQWVLPRPPLAVLTAQERQSLLADHDKIFRH